MRNATLRDVARHAGVHPATASRALNPRTRGLVNDDTAERVRAAAQALGYRPNPLARSLKTSRSASVGVVIPDITNPLFPPIVRGVEDGLFPAGYNAWIVNTDNDEERESALVTSLRSRQVDGLIVATARLRHPLIEDLVAEGFPLVLVNRLFESPSVPAVTGDDSRGVFQAVRHLAKLGHERIAHIAGPQWTSTGQRRLRAYREALGELGLPADPELVAGCDAWSEEEGARAMTRLVDTGARFTAVFAGNDLLALGCYDVLDARELGCPGDVSVVGFIDMAFVDRLRPPLSSVRVPLYQIGAEAARLLLERIDNPGTPVKSVVLPLTLVERQSTGPPKPA